MVILALDQATAASGYSVWSDGVLTDFGKFSFDDADIHKRIHKVCAQLQILLIKYKPEKVILEDIQMQANNVSTFQKLAWLQGALIETCWNLGMPVELIRPNEWRAICHFLKDQDKHRDAQKKIAQQWVHDTFNKVCTQDEADAICIGYAASQSMDNELNWE